MPDLATGLLLAAVVTVAFVAKGAAGFGEGLILMPLCALFVDVRLALVIGLVASHGADYAILARGWRQASREQLGWIVLPAVLGVAAGAALQPMLSAASWRRALGIVVGLAALRLLLWDRRGGPERPPRRLLSAVAGGAAGLLDVLFGTGGPPLIIYLSWRGLGPAAFRATFVLAAALGLHLPRFVAYGASGLLTGPALLTALLLLPAMLLGVWLGGRLHPHINPARFRQVTALLLVVVSLELLI